MRNKLLYFLAFLFISFPMTTFAQMSLYDLPRFKSAVGIAFEQYQHNRLFSNICGDLRFNVRTFRASLDYGYSDDIKVSLIPGVSFTDVNVVDVPPSPSCEIRLANIGRLGTTNLDYYVVGSFGGNYFQMHSECDILHLVNMNLTGGVGLSHTLVTDGELVLRPFFGTYYSNVWKNISTQRQIFVDTTRGRFTGEAGIEADLTPSISAIAVWAFSFESSAAHFQIGLNFH